MSGDKSGSENNLKIGGLSVDTILAGYDPCPDDPYGATSMPIYQTATFQQENATVFGEFDYTRSGNPTRKALETEIALLENSPNCSSFCFSTGMAAIAAVIELAHCGDEIIINDDSYGGTYRIMSQLVMNRGIKISYFNVTGAEGAAVLQQIITKHTRLVFIESPTNPLMRVCDIAALAKVCHSNHHPRGTLLACDNTMLSPIFCHPLTLGCDVVIHSATKFFSGHADTMAGIVSVHSDLSKPIEFIQNVIGNALAPFDCFLVLRGMKTMALRVRQQNANAMAMAQYLQSSHYVSHVYHPMFLNEDDLAIHQSQSTGHGAVVSFLTGDVIFSEYIVNHTKLFKITVSFGSTASLISLPNHMSHASIPMEVKWSRDFPEDLIRLCVGIEDVNDLIHDLETTMQAYHSQKHNHANVHST